MRGHVWMMMAVGLLAMFGFWWKSWEVDQAKLEQDAPITHCGEAVLAAERVACPQSHPVCWTGDRTPVGVCVSHCSFVSSCPKNWCCQSQDDGSQVCTPGSGCAVGAPRAE
ncbi:MAG: hypothetical protein ACI9U2_004705 [Bradymonadia bacterium]|jgi:hypothetical protein